MNFTFHAQSDTGRVRELNEDAILTHRPDGPLSQTRGDLLVVADGMGGHQSGEVASHQTVETLGESYYRAAGDPSQALVIAIQEANRAVYERALAENRRGMGTTVVAAARIGDQLYIAHVGDSRLYLIRDGAIRRLTEDHSLVEEQVAAGLITPEEAEHHPHRNVISRAVGTAPDVEVELAESSPLTLRDGDTLVLCSDGLTEHVKPPRILQLAQHRPPGEAVHTLIQAANAGGGSDNVSVIVARMGEPPPPDAETVSTPSAADTTPLPPPPTPAKPPPPLTSGGRPTEEGDGPGFSFAILSIVGSLILLVILSVLAWNLFGQLDPTDAPVAPTATTQNSFVATPTSELEVEVTATLEGGIAPATPTAESPDEQRTPTPEP